MVLKDWVRKNRSLWWNNKSLKGLYIVERPNLTEVKISDSKSSKSLGFCKDRTEALEFVNSYMRDN